MKKEQGQVKPAAATGGGNPGGGVTKAPTPDGGGGGVKSDNDLSGTDLGNTPIGTPMGSVASAGGPPDRYVLTSHSQTCNDKRVFQVWGAKDRVF